MTREEEIRARCEAATPGPWTLGDDADIKAESTSIAGLLNTLNDAEFIAHAREDIPYLLDENARLRTELDAAKRDMEYLAKRDVDPCDYCSRKGACNHPASCPELDYYHFEWRGLCAENGGAK